jgi:hypothetical protein
MRCKVECALAFHLRATAHPTLISEDARAERKRWDAKAHSTLRFDKRAGAAAGEEL